MTPAPVAWVVCGRFGETSQPWIWRQVTAFRRLRPEVVTGAYERPDLFPLQGVVPVHLVPAVGKARHGRTRWLYRAAALPGRNFVALDPVRTRRLVALAHRRRPAVALCHFGHVALRVLPAARSARLPVVVHFHGLDLSSSLGNRWYRWSLEAALREFAGAVVVGTHQRQWLLEHGMPEERVHLIPCGVPVAQYKVRQHAGTHPVRFATVSRLVPWKGVDETLRAFARAFGSRPGARLDVVGDGPDRRALETLARELGVASAVVFHGALPPAAAAAILASADVFLQHSVDHTNGWIEGFGVSITEASASGLPVVVTRCGGIPDQVVDGETGYLVDQHDVARMAERMRALAGDPALRQRMGETGRQLVERRYDTPEQVARLEAVLLDAAR